MDYKSPPGGMEELELTEPFIDNNNTEWSEEAFRCTSSIKYRYQLTIDSQYQSIVYID